MPRPNESFQRLGKRSAFAEASVGSCVFVSCRLHALSHHDVLIFGASCRAAAFSALRSGLRPRCADYFADRDLAEVCPVVRIDPQSARREFLAFADSLPASPWFYAGGFENHPGSGRARSLASIGFGAHRANSSPRA